MAERKFIPHGGSYGAGKWNGGPYGGYEQFDIFPYRNNDGSGKTNHKRSEQWEECQRCGFIYPLSELRIQRGDGGGVIVCLRTCYDEPSREDMRPDKLPQEEPLLFVDDEGPRN